MAYPSTSTIPAQRLSTALTILRLVLGGIFIAHGAQKLFVIGLAGVAGFFGQVGAPMPGITAPVVTFLEFFGGIAVVLGLFTRPIALLLAIDMLGAISIVHLSKGFFLPEGYEFALSLLGISLAVALAGAGEYSVDRVLAGRKAEVRRHG